MFISPDDPFKSDEGPILGRIAAHIPCFKRVDGDFLKNEHLIGYFHCAA